MVNGKGVPGADVHVRGVGVDVVDLDEFARGLGEPGTRFSGVFSPTERRQVRERAAERGARDDLSRHLGARWAAKEAVVKAWSGALRGTQPAIRPDELDWAEIETVLDAWGRPSVRLSGRVATEVHRTVGECTFHLSLSHDGGTAAAFVVLEAEPDSAG